MSFCRWQPRTRWRCDARAYLGLQAVRVHLGILALARLGFHFGNLDGHLVDGTILVHGFRPQLEVVTRDGNLAIVEVSHQRPFSGQGALPGT